MSTSARIEAKAIAENLAEVVAPSYQLRVVSAVTERERYVGPGTTTGTWWEDPKRRISSDEPTLLNRPQGWSASGRKIAANDFDGEAAP